MVARREFAQILPLISGHRVLRSSPFTPRRRQLAVFQDPFWTRHGKKLTFSLPLRRYLPYRRGDSSMTQAIMNTTLLTLILVSLLALPSLGQGRDNTRGSELKAEQGARPGKKAGARSDEGTGRAQMRRSDRARQDQEERRQHDEQRHQEQEHRRHEEQRHREQEHRRHEEQHHQEEEHRRHEEQRHREREHRRHEERSHRDEEHRGHEEERHHDKEQHHMDREEADVHHFLRRMENRLSQLEQRIRRLEAEERPNRGARRPQSGQRRPAQPRGRAR